MGGMIFVRPDPDPKSPGWRIRLERADGEMAKLSEERVLPEKVLDPQANLTEPADCFWLRRDDAVWLREALGTLLRGWPADLAEPQVKPCVYCRLPPVLAHTSADGMRPTSWGLACGCGRGATSTESYDNAVERWNDQADDAGPAAQSASWQAFGRDRP